MDEDLPFLELIQVGDDRGLVELMDRHKVAVFRFIIRYVGNETDAADLTEETFYRVYLKASKFRPKAKVRTWIFAIAANLSRDHIRRQVKLNKNVSLNAGIDQDSDGPTLEVFSDSRAGPVEESFSRESLQEIESAIQSLPEKLKFPFIFCVLEENSYDECGEVLKVNRKTVETRIYRARQHLRKSLAHLHGKI